MEYIKFIDYYKCECSIALLSNIAIDTPIIDIDATILIKAVLSSSLQLVNSAFQTIQIGNNHNSYRWLSIAYVL